MDGRTPSVIPRGRLCCHCLLIETAQSLVLVDTGFGLNDVRHPRSRLSAFFLALLAPDFREELTAVRQVERLGQLWSSRTRWHTYRGSEGDRWFGFSCVRPLRGLGADLALVPLTGHTLGHAGVAIRTLAEAHGQAVQVCCSHHPVEFERITGRSLLQPAAA